MSTNTAYIMEILEKSGIQLPEDKAERLKKYYEILVEWNQVMNLTAVTDFEEVVKKHFADSLTLSRVMDPGHIGSLIDVGTGAGFPGLPLAILYPEIQVTLLDSLNKRIKFLQTVVQELNIKNVQTIHARAEEGARQRTMRESFDVAVSRAVANLSTLSEYCLPYVKCGGSFVAYKSVKIDEELPAAEKALAILGGKCQGTEKFELFGMERALVVIKKVKKTPGIYPRKAGTPSKTPLGCG